MRRWSHLPPARVGKGLVRWHHRWGRVTGATPSARGGTRCRRPISHGGVEPSRPRAPPARPSLPPSPRPGPAARPPSTSGGARRRSTPSPTRCATGGRRHPAAQRHRPRGPAHPHRGCRRPGRRVTDEDGRILWSAGGATMRRAAERRSVPGGRWDEASAGTNALGLALLSGQPRHRVLGRALVRGGAYDCAGRCRSRADATPA
jgi:hypothetical protein